MVATSGFNPDSRNWVGNSDFIQFTISQNQTYSQLTIDWIHNTQLILRKFGCLVPLHSSWLNTHIRIWFIPLANRNGTTPKDAKNVSNWLIWTRNFDDKNNNFQMQWEKTWIFITFKVYTQNFSSKMSPWCDPHSYHNNCAKPFHKITSTYSN